MRVLKFISLWFLLTVCFSLFNSAFVIPEILIQTINSALFTIGFYFSYHYLIKPFLYKGKVATFTLLYLLVVTCLSSISRLSIYGVYAFENNKFYLQNYWTEPVFYTSTFTLMLLVTSSLLSFRFLKDKMQTQSILENLEKEKISTELSFLKAQINPHLLFNSLNNILFQIDKTNREARDTLLKFSEMLRYQLYDCSADRIEIEKELQYLKNYIEIQMLRKTEKYNCDLLVSDTVQNFTLAPLLLIPFVENAFKHISNHTSLKNSININIAYREGQFIFSVSNDKDRISATVINENKGIGLANVKRRLDLSYEDKYALEIVDGENQFSVTLTLEVA